MANNFVDTLFGCPVEITLDAPDPELTMGTLDDYLHCPYCGERLIPFRSDTGPFRYGWQCGCNPLEERRRHAH